MPLRSAAAWPPVVYITDVVDVRGEVVRAGLRLTAGGIGQPLFIVGKLGFVFGNHDSRFFGRHCAGGHCQPRNGRLFYLRSRQFRVTADRGGVIRRLGQKTEATVIAISPRFLWALNRHSGNFSVPLGTEPSLRELFRSSGN